MGGEIEVAIASRGALLAQDGRTPLHDAAYNGHELATRMLLERGANIEARDMVGTSLCLVGGGLWGGVVVPPPHFFLVGCW